MKTKSINQLARSIGSSPDKSSRLFRGVALNRQGDVLLRLSPQLQEDVLSKLHDKEIVSLVEYLDPDETADVLQQVPEKRRDVLLRKLGREIREKVEFLLRFNPDTAAGVMSLEYVKVDERVTFKELAQVIARHEERTGKVPALLVTRDGYLVGEVPVHLLAIADPSSRITAHVKPVPSIQYNADEDDVVSSFEDHEHGKLVVLNDNNSILGVVFTDDILRILRDRPAEHLRDFAGVHEDDDVLASVATKVRHRYRWLILNLFTAFLAASVVSLFENTIATFTLLAVYMPIVAGMGGNAATQTLAVVVRGLALKKVDFNRAGRIVASELATGTVNGVINGVLVAAVATLWNGSPMLGVVIGIAMVVNLFIAGLFGALIPLTMARLGKDPAASATIFITTATDVFGFFVFLGLASVLL